MATKQCPSCGKRIMEKETSCPHCGELTPVKAVKSPVIKPQNENTKLMTCPSCETHISKNAISCPKCGEPINVSVHSSSSQKERLIGFAGAALLAIGSFLPAINIPIRGSISYLNGGKGDGMLVLFIAFLAFYYAFKMSKRSLMLSGLFSLAVIGYGFVNILQKVAEVKGGVSSGLGQMLLNGVGVGPAFGVTAVGAILIIISSLMIKNKS